MTGDDVLIVIVYVVGVALGWMLNDICNGNDFHRRLTGKSVKKLEERDGKS